MSKYLYLKIVSTSKYGEFGRKVPKKIPWAFYNPLFCCCQVVKISPQGPELGGCLPHFGSEMKYLYIWKSFKLKKDSPVEYSLFKNH
jgi:hypothetical protein